MKKQLISVVIPVYKVEEYIHRCVNSVLNQTYENLEIILVDDGSPDNCPKICDEYVKKDKRIKVIHKKNGGLSDARNVGIENCHGKYITFIDSDDWIPKNSIKNLYENIINNDADISSGIIKETFTDNTKDIEEVNNDIDILNTADALEALMYLHNLSNSASGKIYKTELFKDIRYPIGKYYEDLAVTYKVVSKAKRIVLSNNVVYYYFQNNDSIMHKKYSSKRLESYNFVLEELDFIEKKYPKIRNAAIYRLFFECLFIMNDMPYNCSDKKQIKETIIKYRKSVINDKKISRKQRFLGYSSYFGQFGIKTAFYIRKILKRR